VSAHIRTMYPSSPSFYFGGPRTRSLGAENYESWATPCASRTRLPDNPRSRSGARARCTLTAYAALCALAFVVLVPGSAVYAADPVSPPVPQATTEVRAGEGGFSLRSADGAFALTVRGYVQSALRIYVDDPQDVFTNKFYLARARPIMQVRAYDLVSLVIVPDLSAGTLRLLDTYIDVAPMQELTFRLGLMKNLFGIERLQSPTGMAFLTRAFPSSISPNRDIGVAVLGVVADAFDYAIGVFNGAADGETLTRDRTDAFDLNARVRYRPLARASVPALTGVSFGLGATWGRERGDAADPGLASYRSIGGRTFFAYGEPDHVVDPDEPSSPAPPVSAHGTRVRMTANVVHSYRGWMMMAEVTRALHEVQTSTGSVSAGASAWHVLGGYAFGGDFDFRGVHPRRPVGSGGVGALALKFRVHGLTYDEATMLTAAASGSAARVLSFGTGLNWSMNKFARVMLDIDHTSYADRAGSQVIPNETLFTLVGVFSF